MNIIPTAFAADAAPQAGGDMSMIIVLTVCMVAVYFFIMRPNSKKRKEMQKLLETLMPDNASDAVKDAVDRRGFN